MGSALFAGPAIVRGQNLNSEIRLACIGVNMKSTNIPEASRLVKREYRKGWEPAV